MTELRPHITAALARLAHRVYAMRTAEGRTARYARAIAIPLAGAWLVVLAVLLFAPSRYESEFTLIIPGSGVGTSINLESIGQASATTASAFSSPALSPTENYKRLLITDKVVAGAAKRLDVEPGDFPRPDVTLIDQTNLLEVSVLGGTGEESKRNADALIAAFLDALDELRTDEAARREEADSKRLVELAAKVAAAQRAVLEFQAKSGLVSLDQFDARISMQDELRDRERLAVVALSQTSAMRSRLASVLDVTPSTANRALRLQADPVFGIALQKYAELSGEDAQSAATLGPAHPRAEQLAAEKTAVLKAMAQRGKVLAGLDERTVLRFADLTISNNRATLFEGLLGRESETAGAKAALGQIRRQIVEQADEKQKLVRDAAKLTELGRDLRVAEAVFSSALARVDTNKSDPFASYPMVQTLQGPSLPSAKSSPRPVLVIAGAIAASILILIFFALLWLREPLIRKILPRD